MTLVNTIIATPNNECIRMNGSGAAPATLRAFSTLLSCNATKYLGTGSYTAAQVMGFFNPTANNNRDNFTPTLSSVFINGSNETGAVAASVSGLGAFFTPVTYVGAVQNAADNWFAGWTCNSATANFGTGNSGNCTTLPTT